jgi:hypothetical protein
MTYSEEHRAAPIAVWYGDHELTVLVDWRTGRAVGLVRYNGDQTWSVKVYMPRWRALIARPAWPLATLRGGILRAWYGLPDRAMREMAVMDIEHFYEDREIVPQDGTWERQSTRVDPFSDTG